MQGMKSLRQYSNAYQGKSYASLITFMYGRQWLGRKGQSNCRVCCIPWEVHRDQNSRHSFVVYSLHSLKRVKVKNRNTCIKNHQIIIKIFERVKQFTFVSLGLVVASITVVIHVRIVADRFILVSKFLKMRKNR